MHVRSRARRAVLTGTLFLAGATLLAGPGTGCFNFAAQTALTSADFCFIFDCTNGIFGGVVDPCAANATGVTNEVPLFTDCP